MFPVEPAVLAGGISGIAGKSRLGPEFPAALSMAGPLYGATGPMSITNSFILSSSDFPEPPVFAGCFRLGSGGKSTRGGNSPSGTIKKNIE